MHRQMEKGISMYELGMKSMGWKGTEICSIVQNFLSMHWKGIEEIGTKVRAIVMNR